MAKKHLLIIEDDTEFQQLLRDYLMEQDVKISHAMDGYGGIVEAVKGRPDVILLDLNLPKYNGMEVLRGLRGDAELCDVPIVVLTNDSSDELEAEAKMHDVEDYLIKAETSLSKIREILDGYFTRAKPIQANESLLMAQNRAHKRVHETIKLPVRVN